LSFDALSSRVELLKKENKVIAALDAIRLVRLQVLENINHRDIASDETIASAVSSIKKGGDPFHDAVFLADVNWRRCSEEIRRFLLELTEAGLRNGSLSALITDLRREKDLSYHLFTASIDKNQGHLEFLASKYGVEPELLGLIAATPLLPVFSRVSRALLPADRPAPVTACVICGSSPKLGVYRGGFRYILCLTCGHRMRVDTLFCPSCGNTDPHSLGFTKPEEEPALQIDYCTKCKGYIRTVNEDIIPSETSDPLLIELATADLNSVARGVLEENGVHS